MSKVSVFDHGWIDLVFEGRNQSYGAYQLRKQDSKTTLLALFTGIGVMVLLISIPTIVNFFRADQVIPDITTDTTGLQIIKIEQPVLELPKPKPVIDQSAGGAAQSNVATVEFRPIEATSQSVTTTLTNEVLTNTQPAGVTTQGIGTDPNLGRIGTDPTGIGNTPNEVSGNSDAIETFVDVAPQYPGGLDKFRKDVGQRFDTSGVESAATMKIFVSFVVEPDGTLSNIKTTRDPGYGMGAEAVRVLKSLKAKWKPGIKGGKAVRTAYSLPITVRVN
jgi:protein TonB